MKSALAIAALAALGLGGLQGCATTQASAQA